MKRSKVVIIVGALFILGGIQGMFSPFAARIVSDSGILPPEQQEVFRSSWLLTPLGHIYALTIGLASLVSGIGLFMLKNWARMLVLLLAAVSLIQGAIGILANLSGMLGQPLGGLVLSFGIISVVGW